MYFCLAGAATKELPVYVRLKLNSKNRWANAFMDQSTILIGITLLSKSVRAMVHAPQEVGLWGFRKPCQWRGFRAVGKICFQVFTLCFWDLLVCSDLDMPLLSDPYRHSVRTFSGVYS